jgi:glycosyltransferase involved in cell wall biosynthesis
MLAEIFGVPLIYTGHSLGRSKRRRLLNEGMAEREIIKRYRIDHRIQMEENEREVLMKILLLMDKYDLYGKIAIPKKHDFDHEVPELYRLAARKNGVFANSSLTEPFGITLIESAACGLPIIAPRAEFSPPD